MSDDIGTLKTSRTDAGAQGQTFLDVHGDGGEADRDDDAEILSGVEQWESWWVCSRPHANATFGDTEYIVKRIGADDVVGTQSRCIKIAKAVRDELGRDLDEGEAVIYTSNGTYENYIDLRPGGPLRLKAESGANSAVIDLTSTGKVTVTTSGDIEMVPTGVVKVSAGTDYATLFNALKTEFDAFVNAYLAHKHLLTMPGVGTSGTTDTPAVVLTNAARSTKIRTP